MLAYEEFDGSEAAHMMYAKGLGVEAVAILDRRFTDGTWLRAPRAWVELLRWLPQREFVSREEADRRALLFCTALREKPPFTEGLRDAVIELASWATDRPPHVL